MNDFLVEILVTLQADCHSLQELKDFVCRDDFQMKHAYMEAPESSDLHILYDSLLCVINLVSDLNSRCDAAMQQINNPFCDWREVYASEYESILLASLHFLFSMKIALRMILFVCHFLPGIFIKMI